MSEHLKLEEAPSPNTYFRKKCSLNHLMNKSELMNDDSEFMCTSDPRAKCHQTSFCSEQLFSRFLL
jgi:hypothetical protein